MHRRLQRDPDRFQQRGLQRCETDDDCVKLASSCHVHACSVGAVNVGTNPADWARLDTILFECQSDGPPGGLCNIEGECALEVRCGDEGLCIAEF